MSSCKQNLKSQVESSNDPKMFEEDKAEDMESWTVNTDDEEDEIFNRIAEKSNPVTAVAGVLTATTSQQLGQA